jgi:hypothetical protein
MKNFNSTSFFKACSGIALVILAASAFFFSIKPTQATPQNMPGLYNKPMPVAGAGKYSFDYNLGIDANNDFYWQVWVANTETGAYKCYRWDREEQKWVKMFNESMALPELP